VFRTRRACEQLLGPELTAYLLHLRPMEWPIMTAHFLLGALLAVGLRLPPGPAWLGWFIYIVLLNGGTLAINSAYDQDEGDIGYLRQPPRPPRHLALVSGLMLAAAGLFGVTLYAVASSGLQPTFTILGGPATLSGSTEKPKSAVIMQMAPNAPGITMPGWISSKARPTHWTAPSSYFSCSRTPSRPCEETRAALPCKRATSSWRSRLRTATCHWPLRLATAV